MGSIESGTKVVHWLRSGEEKVLVIRAFHLGSNDHVKKVGRDTKPLPLIEQGH